MTNAAAPAPASPAPITAGATILDGKLLGITCNSSFGAVDKAEHGLVEVEVEERHGLIFVA